jgi:hypothetical protein
MQLLCMLYVLPRCSLLGVSPLGATAAAFLSPLGISSDIVGYVLYCTIEYDA